MLGKSLWILLLVLYVSSAAARTDVSSMGIAGKVHQGGDYAIESSVAPGFLYEDNGGTGKYEVISIRPSKTVYSDQYVVYSDNFDTDNWKNDSHSFYGIARGTTFGTGNETALYPAIKDELTYIRYRFNFIASTDSVTFRLTGNKKELMHNLSVWASQDNITYTKIIDFNELGDFNKQAEIISYLKDNQTWIEFRFFRSSGGISTPRIYDFSLEALYRYDSKIPNVYAITQNTSHSDNFDTDNWKNDSHSFYGIARGTTFGTGNETALYPTIKDELTYIRYRFNFTALTDSVILRLSGNKRELMHNLSVWASQDNITYTKIIDFNELGDFNKQADITRYLKDNQTWIEFRFFRSSGGINMPRIYDFSISKNYYEWRPANITIGGTIELPSSTIDRGHFYYFAPHYSSAAGVTAARIAYLGTKYPAIDIDSQRAVLGRFVKSDADLVLSYGTRLSLGSGFVLEIEDMGDKGKEAVVLLKKDGKLLDRGVYEAGKTYSFKTEVEGVKDVELFRADVVSVYRSSFRNRVELRHAYLLDTGASIIKQGDSFGDFEADLADFDKDGDTDITIRLKKDRTFTLARNSTIDLFGGLAIRVADSDDMRFAVIKRFQKSGTYRQTGPYGKYGQSYYINSFDAPGLFTYDMDKNNTFESLSISSSTMKINDISYSSLNMNGRIAYLGKTYQINSSGEKMVLNEILKEENEKRFLKSGSPLYMEGFILELLDVGERTALLQLKKGNSVLEKSTVENGSSFVYKKSIEGKEIEIFNATVESVFSSDFAAAVEIGKLLLLDDSEVIVKDGDAVGSDYEADITDINGDGAADIMVKLKSGKSFSVSEDSTTGILGGYLSLKAYESTFLPTRSIAINTSGAPADAPQIMPTAAQAQAPDHENTVTQAASADETPVLNDKDDGAEQDVPVIYILGIVSAVSLSAATYTWFRSKK